LRNEIAESWKKKACKNSRGSESKPFAPGAPSLMGIR
jgi:hypothetical protein